MADRNRSAKYGRKELWHAVRKTRRRRAVECRRLSGRFPAQCARFHRLVDGRFADLLMRRGSRHQVGREVLFQRRAVEEKRDSGDLRLERIWCSGVHWHSAADIFSRRHFSALNAKRPMKKEPNQSTTAQRAGWPFWVLLNLRPPARG